MELPPGVHTSCCQSKDEACMGRSSHQSSSLDTSLGAAATAGHDSHSCRRRGCTGGRVGRLRSHRLLAYPARRRLEPADQAAARALALLLLPCCCRSARHAGHLTQVGKAGGALGARVGGGGRATLTAAALHSVEQGGRAY